MYVFVPPIFVKILNHSAAMLENFALIEEKIQHLNSPIFILDGVYKALVAMLKNKHFF